MEPVTTTLSLIAIVKAGLDHAEDLKSIGSSLDNLFSHHDERKAEETQQQKVLRKRTGESGKDENSISAVMDEVLTEKSHQIAIESLAKEINKKWPTPEGEPTTWEVILTLREEKLARAKILRIRKKKKDEEFFDTVFAWLKNITILSGVAIAIAVAGYVVYINRCVNATCS